MMPKQATTAEAFLRLHPKEYIKKFLNNKLRTDGRTFNMSRKINLTTNNITTAEASTVLRLGKTMVVAGVKAEIAEPKWDAPENGYVVVNIELGPLCSNKYKSGPPNNISMTYSHLLNKIANSKHIFDLTQLNITSGKAVWTLYIDIICLADDGNVLDAAIMALINTLKNVSLPSVELDEEQGIYIADKQKKTPLNVKSNLYPLTFGIFEEDIILSDPNSLEEGLINNFATFVIDDEDQLIFTHKTGSIPIDKTKLNTCFEETVSRKKNLMKTLLKDENNDME